MPEAATRERLAWAALGVALLATLAMAAGGLVAALAGWLAQPAWSLGLRLRLRRGCGVDRTGLRGDALVLLLLWGVSLAGAAALVAWPLSTLQRAPSLGAVAGLSAVAGVLLVALWRIGPLWEGCACEGGTLQGHWRALAERDHAHWGGLAPAVAIAAVLALVLVAAWPGLLSGGGRAVAAGLACMVSPLAHWVLQRRAAPLATLEIIDMPAVHNVPGGDATVPPDAEADAEADADADADAEADAEADAVAALHAAARSGRVDQALALLAAGADPLALPDPADRDQRALPVLAAVLPDLRLLRDLIGRGVDLNLRHAGMTPLLAATRDSWHGRPEAVMTLLANGADPRATDHDGNTPLHHAARSSDPGVAALLRDAAAEIDALNAEGVTPLGIACASGNWRLARFLLERGAKPEPAGGMPAMLAAAGGEEDDAAGVLLLLKHKARIDARDARGRSALHEAAHAGHGDILAALLDAHADADARDAAGRTPLLDAARGGRLSTLDALAPRSDATAVDADGRSAIALACAATATTAALLQRLLALGVTPDVAGVDGRRPVDQLAAAGRWALVSALDPGYALPASVAGEAPAEGAAPARDRPPLELLREQLRAGRTDGLEALVPLVTPAALGILLRDAEVPVTAARVDWLLAHGADPDVRDGDADSAIFALLAEGPDALPALQALLRAGVSPGGAGGLAVFMEACARGDQAGRALEQCALELVARGADPFAATPGGDPPLCLAVRLGWLQVLDRLLSDGLDPDARDGHGMTALHLAAALGREPALKRLVQAGASPAVRAADGQTPLGLALSAGRRDLADWLDWRGWALPGRPLAPGDLPAAAMAGDADAVRRLLALDIAVDAPDAQGCSALLRAAGGGHADVVETLLARGADPQHAASTGATPLSAAVSMRQGAIVERLLAAGAGMEQRLPGEVTVLMLAAALGLPDICARLLAHGADVQAVDAQGLAPLHCAALFGFTARDRARLLALLDTLLLAGAEPDAAAAGGVTPMLLLLGARAEPGTACDEDVVLAALERLVDEDVALDAQDPRGFGPLHLAALHGQLRFAQRLLRAGCDPDLRDALNRTPREVAVMRGFVDVAAEFAPVQAGVSMARFLREPR